MARNMKCGGTQRQKAERLMLCRGKALSELPVTVFVKGAAPAQALDPEKREKHLAFSRSFALLEAQAAAVAESLSTVVDNTATWVMKKQAQNYEELKADLEREDLDDAPEGSDEDVRTFHFCHGCVVLLRCVCGQGSHHMPLLRCVCGQGSHHMPLLRLCLCSPCP